MDKDGWQTGEVIALAARRLHKREAADGLRAGMHGKQPQRHGLGGWGEVELLRGGSGLLASQHCANRGGLRRKLVRRESRHATQEHALFLGRNKCSREGEGGEGWGRVESGEGRG